jgi:hypothetical protein
MLYSDIYYDNVGLVSSVISVGCGVDEKGSLYTD